MAKALGVKTQKQGDATLLGPMPCSLSSAGMSLVFGFDGDAVKMSVPLSNLMVPDTGNWRRRSGSMPHAAERRLGGRLGQRAHEPRRAVLCRPCTPCTPSSTRPRTRSRWRGPR
ncbi:hypothetical protein CTA2_6345 [Colletotrichum tanaceti]|uniref:Uncharacterized protein n=1 Tax=Colletotrichum tanaceti TaxID=1306861 RepID=A0A4U6X0D2_9PEZI|nr:hypothetical protein CTA2_6345 [Colletotrichum tanaceti]TKW48832.1 hypothetical protein CTA1_11855 [Colletotrichum tanaceti]